MADAKVIEGSCKNGHLRTEENTTFQKDSGRNRFRIRCLDCKRAGREDYTGRGREYANELSTDAMEGRHEDIEHLIDSGVRFDEIVRRSAYSNRLQMRRSLREAGRADLLEKLDRREQSEKQGQGFMVRDGGLSFEINRRPSKTFKIDGER